MKDTEKRKEFSCKAPVGKGEVKWDNYPGINAPSETAKSLMDSEGYVSSETRLDENDSDAGE